MKKIRKILVFVLVLFMGLNITVRAKSTTLVHLTRNTYAINEHKDGLEFDYNGYLSINGFESFWESGKKYLPLWISMTYERGNKTLSHLKIKARGSETVRGTLKEKDSWDLFGNQTKVFYNYDSVRIGNNVEAWSVKHTK